MTRKRGSGGPVLVVLVVLVLPGTGIWLIAWPGQGGAAGPATSRASAARRRAG